MLKSILRGAAVVALLPLLGGALVAGAQPASASAADEPEWKFLSPSYLQSVCAMVETPTAPPPTDRPVALDVKTAQCPTAPDRRFQWKFISMGDGTVQIKHDRSNGCLDGTAPAIASPDSVAVTACHVATAGQRWLATEYGPIKNVATGQYLHADGGSDMVPYHYNLALTSSDELEWDLAADPYNLPPHADSDEEECDAQVRTCPDFKNPYSDY